MLIKQLKEKFKSNVSVDQTLNDVVINNIPVGKTPPAGRGVSPRFAAYIIYIDDKSDLDALSKNIATAAGKRRSKGGGTLLADIITGANKYLGRSNMNLQEIKIESAGASSEYQAEQIQTVRKIHEQLMQNLDRRFTIEALARQYLMNPTTLKAVFKSVYGSSLAAHMKEHRMEHAAKLLVETRQSIAEIARAVGYDSQSKFSAAFKEAFQCLPKEYRKKHGC